MNVLLIYIIILVILIIVYFINGYFTSFESFDTKTNFIQGELPEQYYDEIKKKLMKYFNEPSNVQKNILTNDNNYKCTFVNHIYRDNLLFQKTIIDEKHNDIYNVDTTKCSKNIDSENCNDDNSNNIKIQLFYKNNEFIDYNDEKYDIFLKGYDLVEKDKINDTFTKSYEICKPKEFTYQLDDDFRTNYPCGVLFCKETSADEKDSENYDYESIGKTAKQYWNEIVKDEYKSKIDTILESLGFKTWINILNENQKQNEEIMAFNPPDDSFNEVNVENNANDDTVSI